MTSLRLVVWIVLLAATSGSCHSNEMPAFAGFFHAVSGNEEPRSVLARYEITVAADETKIDVFALDPQLMLKSLSLSIAGGEESVGGIHVVQHPKIGQLIAIVSASGNAFQVVRVIGLKSDGEFAVLFKETANLGFSVALLEPRNRVCAIAHNFDPESGLKTSTVFEMTSALLFERRETYRVDDEGVFSLAGVRAVVPEK